VTILSYFHIVGQYSILSNLTMTYDFIIFGHLRNGVVYIFGGVYMYVGSYMCVCVYVCMSIIR